MTYIKNAFSRARPEIDIFESETRSTGVLIAVLALIFAPIILAHAVSLAEEAPAAQAVVQPAR